MAKNIEDELLSYEEFVDLAALAESFRQYDNKRQDLFATLPKTSPKGMNIQECLEEAESIGIPKEYFLRAINTKVPSIEDQLAQLKEHNGSPSIVDICNVYYKNIMNKLKESFPFHKFSTTWYNTTRYNQHHPEINFFQVLEKEKKERSLFREKTMIIRKKKSLAWTCFTSDFVIPTLEETFGLNVTPTPKGTFGLNLHLTDPRFIHCCGETIKKINKYFKDKGQLHFYTVKYKYPKNLEEIGFKIMDGQK